MSTSQTEHGQAYHLPKLPHSTDACDNRSVQLALTITISRRGTEVSNPYIKFLAKCLGLVVLLVLDMEYEECKCRVDIGKKND